MGYSRVRRTFNVEHRFLECKSSFDEVHRALLAILPPLKQEIGDMLARGEREKVEVARRSGEREGDREHLREGLINVGLPP